MKNALIAAAAAVVGVLPAFFLVFQSLFTDSAGYTERISSFVLIAVGYGLLGALFGYLARSAQSGLWLGAPALVLVALYSVREPQQLLLHAAVLAVALGAGHCGASWGARLRKRQDR